MMKAFYFIPFLCLFFIGCKEEDKVNKEWQDSEFALTFGEASEFSLTRGTPVTAFKDGDSFGVLAYHYPSSAAITTPNLMYNTKVTNTGGNWEYNPLAYWPNDATKNVDFFAYYPHNSTDTGISLSSNTATGYPSFDYTVSTDITTQQDLMVAARTAATHGNLVDLDFKHALAKISFSIKGDPRARIEKITIKDIQTTAKLTFDGTANVFGWTNTSNPSDFIATKGDELADTGSGSITTDSGYVFMIPQNVSGKTITLEITDACGAKATHDVTLPSSHQWEAGEAYNYSIFIDDNGGVLNPFIVPTQKDIEDTANSYMLHPNKFQTYYIPIDQRINRFWYEYSQTCDAVELSGYLVAGGKDDLTAEVLWYDNGVTDGGLTLTLIDSSDAAMNVNTGKITPANEPNFITENARLGLKIELDPSLNDISKHGNVVVSVKRGSTILWSWHLWITDYDPDNGGTVHQFEDGTQGSGNKQIWSTIYKDKYMMNRMMGAVDTLYTPLTTRTGPGILSYQYGRPVPLSPYSNRTVTSANCSTLKAAIQSPDKLISGSWTYELGSNLRNYTWLDKNTLLTSYQKSFFDPCPLGWQVPANGYLASLGASKYTHYDYNRVSYPMPSGGTMSIPRMGYYSGSSFHINSNGHYWTDTYEVGTSILSEHVISRSYGIIFGFGLWPVQE